MKKVSGGHWRSTCAGKTTAGSTWYKITVVKGKSVRSRFGVDAVYVASSLLRKVSLELEDPDRSGHLHPRPADEPRQQFD